MKTKLILLIVLIAALFAACNQSKKTNEKEPEATEVQEQKPAEPVSVKGKITNQETGDAISMAIVIVKGTTTGTMSGPNGDFALQAPAGAKKLVISADGFEAFEADINSKEDMEVKLSPKK